MKVYVVGSQACEAVVAINDDETPELAINKFLKTVLTCDHVILVATECEGDEYSGTWKNEPVEGTYVQRNFIT